MDSRNRAISVTANSDDTKALGAIGRMFLELAGEPAIFAGTLMSMEIQPAASAPLHEAPLAPAAPAAPPAPPAGESEEAQPGDVDTAAVFGNAAPPAPGTPAAPPAPPAAAPPAPPAPAAPATPPPAVELDKNGLPWDARINTSNKAKTGPGVWKRAPKLTDEFYNGVIAELKATMALPAPGAAVPPTPPAPATPPATTPGAGNAPITTAPPPPSATPAAPPTPTPAAAPPATPAPAAPTGSTSTAPPPPPADEVTPATYAQLLGVVAKHIKAGTVTHEEVNSVCVMAGLPDLNAVSARPEFVPSIYEGCKAIWATRG